MILQPTAHFERELKRLVKKYPSLRREIADFGQSLLADPFQGIHLGQNCYKIRLSIASKGRGKSGGARVVTHIRIEEDRIYFLSIYDKADKENLAEDEIDELLKKEGMI